MGNAETAITSYQTPEKLTLDPGHGRLWLDEKFGRSESYKTKHAYDTPLHSFQAMLQGASLDLESEPALIAPLAQGNEQEGYKAHGHQ